ncbi:hypothetical protein BJL90_14510 [Clostridium formicaceticum]|uniref:Uncharacterized protein n=1 Tax=Clostridium formicaceticum TaxID=1497 RepID=A0ABM6EV56_9CLOT|nr:hypothetical protein BJL90_14510 [Clostridium formicaceticum]
MLAFHIYTFLSYKVFDINDEQNKPQKHLQLYANVFAVYSIYLDFIFRVKTPPLSVRVGEMFQLAGMSSL